MSEQQEFTIRLQQREDFEFTVRFDWKDNAELLLDEPEPLGHRRGPNASRVLAAAVGNCLTASLLFCMRKAKLDPRGLETSVTGKVGRNERGRLRLQGLDVRITLPENVDADAHGVDRCLSIFEDYCLVTESVRGGIPIDVSVLRPSGEPAAAGGDA